jgi:hypothetical protein
VRLSQCPAIARRAEPLVHLANHLGWEILTPRAGSPVLIVVNSLLEAARSACRAGHNRRPGRPNRKKSRFHKEDPSLREKNPRNFNGTQLKVEDRHKDNLRHLRITAC